MDAKNRGALFGAKVSGANDRSVAAEGNHQVAVGNLVSGNVIDIDATSRAILGDDVTLMVQKPSSRPSGGFDCVLTVEVQDEGDSQLTSSAHSLEVLRDISIFWFDLKCLFEQGDRLRALIHLLKHNG